MIHVLSLGNGRLKYAGIEMKFEVLIAETDDSNSALQVPREKHKLGGGGGLTMNPFRFMIGWEYALL